jgi:polar amino acid transport system substrate-binding protein
MDGGLRMTRRSLGRGALALFAFVLLALLVLVPAVQAMNGAKVTINKQVGGVPTRFTFEAVSDTDGPTTAIDMTFPAGFDLSTSRVEVITLEGLDRVPVTFKKTVVGQTIKLAFGPPVAANATVRVTTYDVVTPVSGGTFPFGVTYTVNGQQRTVEKLTFGYASLTSFERVSRWMDTQSWIESINSVKVLHLFLTPQQIVTSIPLLFRGWLVSIALVLVAFPLAILVGLLWAFAKMSRIAPLRWLASAYINVIRGTPLLLQIFIVFIGLPIAGIHLPWYVNSVLVLALNSSAYLAEIFRAGIQSIHKGQMEAANSLGMKYPQAMAYVIIPQTVKRVLPTMTSEFILLFKDTALLATVGVFELMMRANNIVSNTGLMTAFVVAAFFYLIVTIPLINYVGRLERKLAVSEGGSVAGVGRKRGVVVLPPPVEVALPEATTEFGPHVDKEG